jgi:hypothetical protein
VGGFWNAGTFNYNTAFMNVNRTVIHNVYNKTVINRNICNHCTRVAFNGGRGGINARPTSGQLEARRRGIAPTSEQRIHARDASQDRSLAARVNHGRPPTTAVQRPINDPKSLPHFQAVNDRDRQAAQADVHHGNAGTMQSAPQHNATQSHPHNNQPPSGTLHSNERSKTTTHGNVPPQMHTNTQMHSNAHSSGNSMHGNAGMYGSRQSGGKPPSGSMQAHPAGNKPAGGNDKNKPPRH